MNSFFRDNANSKKRKITINLIAVFATVALLVIFMSLTNNIFASGSSREESEQYESNKNAIDITEILNKNTENTKRQVVFIEERDIEFTTVHKVNAALPKGATKVIYEGKNGKEQVSIKKVFEDDELIEEDTITNYIIEGPVARIVEIGASELSTSQVAYENRKARLFSNLSFGMDLRKPSGLTFEDFKKIISNEQRDRYNVIANNIETFYYMEQKYNINGIFVMALAIHESGWGTSSISKDKKNLFGYGAYDRDPYNSSSNFDSYAEGIELVSKALVKYYLNPSGTAIFGGQVATGSYYNGSNLAGVNVRYASDPGWGIKVFKIMEYLYGKL